MILKSNGIIKAGSTRTQQDRPAARLAGLSCQFRPLFFEETEALRGQHDHAKPWLKIPKLKASNSMPCVSRKPHKFVEGMTDLASNSMPSI